MMVTKTAMKSASYKAVFNCQTTQGKSIGTTQQSTTLPAAPIRNGKIKKDFKLSGGSDLIQLVATLKGKTVTGYFVEAFSTNAGNICATGGHVHFTLKR